MVPEEPGKATRLGPCMEPAHKRVSFMGTLVSRGTGADEAPEGQAALQESAGGQTESSNEGVCRRPPGLPTTVSSHLMAGPFCSTWDWPPGVLGAWLVLHGVETLVGGREPRVAPGRTAAWLSSGVAHRPRGPRPPGAGPGLGPPPLLRWRAPSPGAPAARCPAGRRPCWRCACPPSSILLSMSSPS